MNYEAVKAKMIQKLEQELPKSLSYHSVNHVKDVLKAAERIAKSENVTETELCLLRTAAVFHDSGFLFGASGHEKKSCEIAREILPEYGYTEKDIEIICGMIMATKLPQSPHNLLEEILADADLDYLGRDDFFPIGNRLFNELAIFGVVNTREDWNRLQIRFLESHHYFTRTAIQQRKAKKDAHLELLKNEINKNEKK